MHCCSCSSKLLITLSHKSMSTVKYFVVMALDVPIKNNHIMWDQGKEGVTADHKSQTGYYVSKKNGTHNLHWVSDAICCGIILFGNGKLSWIERRQPRSSTPLPSRVLPILNPPFHSAHPILFKTKRLWIDNREILKI